MPSTGGMAFFGLITTKENLIVYIRNVKKTEEDSFSCYINNGGRGGGGGGFLRPHFVALCWKSRYTYFTIDTTILP
mgnify:CR=1 FL=1